MRKEVTVAEVAQEKAIMEDTILQALNRFGELTGLNPGAIGVEWVEHRPLGSSEAEMIVTRVNVRVEL